MLLSPGCELLEARHHPPSPPPLRSHGSSWVIRPHGFTSLAAGFRLWSGVFATTPRLPPSGSCDLGQGCMLWSCSVCGCQLISQEQKLQILTQKVPGLVVKTLLCWGKDDLGPCWQEDQWQTSGVHTFIMTGKADLNLIVLRALHESMAGGRELAHSPQVPLGFLKVCGVRQQPSLIIQAPVHHSPLSRPGSKSLHTGGEMYSEKEKYEKRPTQS